MAINYSAPKIAARNIVAPSPNININKALGLRSSPYEGLQQVSGTPYYYANNRMYEAYTPPPPTYNIYGLPMNRPSGGPLAKTGWFFGFGPEPKPSYEELTIDGQQFRTVSPDIAGFHKTALGEDKYAKDSVYEYEPSMAYVYSKSMPNIKAQPNRMFTNVAGYTPASGSLLSNAPIGNSYGAGQYLGSGLLGGALNFGTPSGKTAG